MEGSLPLSLQAKLKQKKTEMTAVPDRWPDLCPGFSAPPPTLAPPGISSSSGNFRKKASFTLTAHRSKQTTTLPSSRAWRNPHTRSLDEGQGHPRAPASTHWATCPLISSSLCLAFQLHRATYASMWGGEEDSDSPEMEGNREKTWFCPQKT